MDNKGTFSLVPQATIDDVRRVDMIVRESRSQMIEARDQPTLQAFIQAKAVGALRAAFTPAMLADVRAMANTPLGFKTDRPPGSEAAKKYGQYTDDDIKECVIVAMFHGMRLVNNEWNIISGEFYAAKNGLQRAVREFPGLTNFRMSLGVPVSAGEKGALVSARASWLLNGKPDSLVCAKTDTEDTRISVRVNAAMGPDAVLGKAERKLYARVLSVLNGMAIPDAEDPSDVGVDNVVEGEFVVDQEPDNNSSNNSDAAAAAAAEQQADDTKTVKTMQHFADAIDRAATSQEIMAIAREAESQRQSGLLNNDDAAWVDQRAAERLNHLPKSKAPKKQGTLA